MIILQHRAQDQKEIDPKFGVEIDVRDFYGLVQMGHDPIDHSSMLLKDWVGEHPDHPMYAVNVKADGLEQQITHMMNKAVGSERWFAFDMSYPTYKRFKKLDAPCAERVSEEEETRFYENRLWVDRWDWSDYPAGYDRAVVRWPSMLETYWVSTELHVADADPNTFWGYLKKVGCTGVCTDYADEAWEFFNA